MSLLGDAAFAVTTASSYILRLATSSCVSVVAPMVLEASKLPRVLLSPLTADKSSVSLIFSVSIFFIIGTSFSNTTTPF